MEERKLDIGYVTFFPQKEAPAEKTTAKKLNVAVKVRRQ